MGPGILIRTGRDEGLGRDGEGSAEKALNPCPKFMDLIVFVNCSACENEAMGGWSAQPARSSSGLGMMRVLRSHAAMGRGGSVKA